MHLRNIVIVVGIVLVGMYSLSLWESGRELHIAKAQDASGRNRPAAGLKAEALQDRERAAKAIMESHRALVKDLVELAGEKVKPIRTEGERPVYPHRDAKHLSILLLGDLRSPEAVPVLLENLEYRNPKSIVVDSLMDMIGGYYPAAESLSKIGMLTIEPVLDKLGDYQKDCKGRELCVWVIKEVLGQKLAKIRLEMAIEEAGRNLSRTKARNLMAAMSYFEEKK